MALEVKICGLCDPAAVAAAVSGGADYVGFVFFPPSPRAISPKSAAALMADLPSVIVPVGLFVDPDDELLFATLALAPVRLLQLHGHESPGRVADIKRRFKLPVMKALPVKVAADLDAAAAFAGVADRLLFDAKPPPGAAVPGGQGIAFDWDLLAGRDWRCPWMLAGGLTADNVGEAVRRSGTRAVDVSSGVESSPGHKSVPKIARFLAQARRL